MLNKTKQRQIKANLGRVIGSFFVFLCVLTSLGCAVQYYDAGENPVPITVDLVAQVDQKKVNETLEVNQLTPPISGGGMFHVIKGPFWRWGLYVMDDKGDLTLLKPENPKDLDAGPSLSIQKNTVFMAPLGKLKLRLLVECFLEHHYFGDMPGGNIDPVGVVTFYQDYELDVSPDKKLVLKKRFKNGEIKK